LKKKRRIANKQVFEKTDHLNIVFLFRLPFALTTWLAFTFMNSVEIAAVLNLSMMVAIFCDYIR